jgi:hypothetical protein
MLSARSSASGGRKSEQRKQLHRRVKSGTAKIAEKQKAETQGKLTAHFSSAKTLNKQ